MPVIVDDKYMELVKKMKERNELMNRENQGKRMTSEEAIKCLELFDLSSAKCSMADAYDAIKIAIKALEQRWIPCSERMPEQPYGCLVTVEDEEPMTGQMFETILPYHVGWDGERWNDSEGEQCPFEVIAWMPLPEPYNAESEEV